MAPITSYRVGGTNPRRSVLTQHPEPSEICGIRIVSTIRATGFQGTPCHTKLKVCGAHSGSSPARQMSFFRRTEYRNSDRMVLPRADFRVAFSPVNGC